MNIVLRSAVMADISILKYWDEQPHVIAAAPNDDWDWNAVLSNDQDWQETLMAVLDERPIGVIQIIDPAREETHYWGEIEENCRAIDIWIGEEKDLGKGYGTQIMKLAIDRCFTDPNVHTIWIDPLESNKDAIRFYERLGFEFVEKRRFDEDECLVYKFTREQTNRGIIP